MRGPSFELLSPADDIDITLVVLRVSIRDDDADALGVRGGWKMCDFAPDRRGGAVSRLVGWKLNAPGIAEGEFAILVLMLVRLSSAGYNSVVAHGIETLMMTWEMLKFDKAWWCKARAVKANKSRG